MLSLLQTDLQIHFLIAGRYLRSVLARFIHLYIHLSLPSRQSRMGWMFIAALFFVFFYLSVVVDEAEENPQTRS